MAVDIVPELLSAIQADFQDRVTRDAAITRLSNRIRDGTATLSDVHDYAAKLGEVLSQVLRRHLTEDVLPDGRLYWNIASRTIRPMLKGNHRLINDAAKIVQGKMDEESGIGLGVLEGEFPEERVARLIDRASDPGNTFEQTRDLLGEPVVNCSEAFYDDCAEANAVFRSGSGLETLIIRTASAGCCAWCADLAGTYRYGVDVRSGDDVFRRHLFCRCEVTAEYRKTRESIWSKKTWQVSESELQKRRQTGMDVFRLSPEAAAETAAIVQERDRAIVAIMREKRVSRERASRIYRDRERRR